MRKYCGALPLAVLFLFLPVIAFCQQTIVTDSSDPNHRTVIAGIEYKRGALYRFFWGSHYRKEWTTPVKVPIFRPDTIDGGLTAYQQGGGRQTKTLRLKNKDGKQYVLRSIDKDYGGALPEIARGTFIESLAKDQVSTAHPYASVTVPQMTEASGIFHTNPSIVFVTENPALGRFNQDFANTLCLFEERPNNDESDEPSFGYSKDVVSTEKMYKKVFEESDHRVDQVAFVRARLFDMFLGDWGRHDDQWRWAKFDSADFTIYKPIPRDRDQAYTKFDGLFPFAFTTPEQLEHLKTFKGHIKNIKKYNFPARYIDRQLTNEVPEQVWIDQAKDLQRLLTDDVIENAVKQMPPEAFKFSGEEIISKLKSRRGHLEYYAKKYYKYLTKEVEIVGTHKGELFEIKRLEGGQTQINLFDLNKEGQPKDIPFYSRVFYKGKTHEIRLYGLSGNDIYRIDGQGSGGIKVRLIGGIDKDSVINETAGSGKIKYYDNPGNSVTGNVQEHISSDTAINSYNYRSYRENSGHTIKTPYYSNTRGIFVMGGYTYTHMGWRKEPFSWKQSLAGVYSITNNAFGGQYNGIFTHVIGKWDLYLSAVYDAVAKNYFYGVGNETKYINDLNYYKFRTQEGSGDLSLRRRFGRYHYISFGGLFQSTKVWNDQGHLISDLIPTNSDGLYDRKYFAGGEISYTYENLNNRVVPTKGVIFSASANYVKNLHEDRAYDRYLSTFSIYLPLSGTFSLAIRAGGATVTGSPEFYQLNWLGGGPTLRGFHRQRFYGRTSFYDQNEIRWITNTHNYIFNGKIGLAAFIDDGRVWQPDENSSTWHIGYGGGLILAPFDKVSITVYYGLSKEDQLFHIRFGLFF